jgi:putative hydrolase of the HAD superfamily
MASEFTAVFWDFGGVILSSPFDAFDEYERTRGLPAGFLRSVNTIDPDTNAWAQIERRTITPEQFDIAFADESARLGHRVPGGDLLALLEGPIRPEMVAGLDRVIEAGFVTACLTNNVVSDARDDVREVMARFDHVIESSIVGVRKPDPEFYELACATAGVEPTEVVFLDDLGINLKPARAMGMTTIKVESPVQALRDLGAALGIDLQGS